MRLVFAIAAILLGLFSIWAAGEIFELRTELEDAKTDNALQAQYHERCEEAFDSLFSGYQIANDRGDFWHQEYLEAQKRVDELLVSPIIKEVPVEVEVERIVEVERVVEVPRIISDWDNPEELKAFLEADDTDSHYIFKAGGDGVIEFSNQCEDIAFQLWDRAYEIGKRLDVEILTKQEYHQYYGKWLEGNVVHAINKAVIGNEVWLIEPQTDRMWLVYYLD